MERNNWESQSKVTFILLLECFTNTWNQLGKISLMRELRSSILSTESTSLKHLLSFWKSSDMNRSVHSNRFKPNIIHNKSKRIKKSYHKSSKFRLRKRFNMLKASLGILKTLSQISKPLAWGMKVFLQEVRNSTLPPWLERSLMNLLHFIQREKWFLI